MPCSGCLLAAAPAAREVRLREAVGNILVEAVTPITLEVALAIQQELQSRLDEADRLRQQQVERTRYEAELVRRRYLCVDPDNRLVADSLEADWNEKLKLLVEAQQLREQQRAQDRKLLDDEQRTAILSLATIFRAYGAIHPRQIASGSAWRGSCWKTSR